MIIDISFRDMSNLHINTFVSLYDIISSLFHLRERCRGVMIKVILNLREEVKKRLWHKLFLVNFTKFQRTPSFYKTPPFATSGIAFPIIFLERNLKVK